MNGLHNNRFDAKIKGDLYYFPPYACINGHFAKRFTSNYSCLECVKNKQYNYKYSKIREKAKEENKSTYFTGKPCVNGHICERFVKSKNCIECAKNRKRGKYTIKKKEWWLKNIYGLTQFDYDLLLKKQNYECALCNIKLEINKSTHIDHCHETNKIRGILCHSCNVGIGHFKHNSKVLQKAALYCEKI